MSSAVLDTSRPGLAAPLRLAALGLFVLACAFTLYAALAPDDGSTGLLSRLLPWDKARHAAIFYGLAGLAAAAFPRTGLIALGAALAGYGGAIELVQAVAGTGRDAETLDFVANLVGIAGVYGPLLVLTVWRREAGR
ncbi:MAG TPA: hypothetical protein VD929_00910 [Caulobacteraceae bacterium]|nr:hypothetical protein [Caulobacteraceae bacterium]